MDLNGLSFVFVSCKHARERQSFFKVTGKLKQNKQKCQSLLNEIQGRI
jgi:hypothetical protein